MKKVDLKNPEEKYYVILSKHGFWFGQHISDSYRNLVQQRTPHKRPFFHPSAMNPLLLRTMINLAALSQEEWLLDPFCGTAGVLLEGARLGFRCVGVEIRSKIAWGAHQNLENDTKTQNKTHLIFGDARQLSFKEKSITAIVTDPPYGTAASTQGMELQDLLIKFVLEIQPILKPKGRVVISVPASIELEERLAQILNANYKKFFQYVHRSLTRKILVFCRKGEKSQS